MYFPEKSRWKRLLDVMAVPSRMFLAIKLARSYSKMHVAQTPWAVLHNLVTQVPNLVHRVSPARQQSLPAARTPRGVVVLSGRVVAKQSPHY
jgi:hypothetical protein